MIDRLINKLISDKAVYRTAPATPGLLITKYESLTQYIINTDHLLESGLSLPRGWPVKTTCYRHAHHPKQAALGAICHQSGQNKGSDTLVPQPMATTKLGATIWGKKPNL